MHPCSVYEVTCMNNTNTVLQSCIYWKPCIHKAIYSYLPCTSAACRKTYMRHLHIIESINLFPKYVVKNILAGRHTKWWISIRTTIQQLHIKATVVFSNRNNIALWNESSDFWYLHRLTHSQNIIKNSVFMASCTRKNSAFLHIITLIIQLLYTAVFISEFLGGKLPPNFLRFPPLRDVIDYTLNTKFHPPN